MEIRLSRCIALVVLTNAATAGSAWMLLGAGWSSRPPEAPESALLRPLGSVLGRFGRDRECESVTYAGPETLLYADRPYHTRGRVAPLEGHRFCRGKRHGRDLWILDVSRPTALYTIASAAHELERSGWKLFPDPVRVDAAGLALDRLYHLRVKPGRYAIHYGRATTASPVFWNPRDARVVRLPPADG